MKKRIFLWVALILLVPVPSYGREQFADTSSSTMGDIVVTIKGPILDEIVEPVPESIKRLAKSARKHNPFSRIKRASFAQSYFKNVQQKGLPYWKSLPGVGRPTLLLDQRSFFSFFHFALDGELASTMTPDEFVKLLHSAGLTVADAVRIECELKEQIAYRAIRDKAQLSDLEWVLLESVMNLKNGWLEENKGSGHYDESNVVFEKELDPQVMQRVKRALEKADIPFKVVVKYLHRNSNVIASAVFSFTTFTFGYNLQNATSKYRESNGNVSLILNSSYWNLGQESLVQEAILAHEAVHLAYLHMIEELGFRLYFKNIKKINDSDFEKCVTIKKTVLEYQASVLPLADPGYAKAQQYTYSPSSYRILNFLGDCLHYMWSFVEAFNHKPLIHVPNKKLHALATRAVALHEAEQRLLALSAPIKGDAE
jgi:hypothetical protein